MRNYKVGETIILNISSGQRIGIILGCEELQYEVLIGDEKGWVVIDKALPDSTYLVTNNTFYRLWPSPE